MTDNRWNFPTCASSRFHFSYTRKVYSSSTKGRLSKSCWKKKENDKKKTKRAFIKGRKNFLVMTCFLYCNLAFSSGLISLPRNQIIGWSTYRSISTVAAAVVPANENISSRCIINIQTSQWLMIWNCVQEIIIRAEKLKTAVNEFQSEFKWESATNLMQIVHINTLKLIQTFQIAWYLRFSMRYNEGKEKFKWHKLVWNDYLLIIDSWLTAVNTENDVQNNTIPSTSKIPYWYEFLWCCIIINLKYITEKTLYHYSKQH